MPFLLGALDPSAVNQTHQAPVAMNAIKVVFKPLLFPSPAILKYLPDVLSQALPGLDACDSVKTIVTLELFSVILTWLPLKLSYTDTDACREDKSIPQSYLSLVNQLSADTDENDQILLDDKKNAKIYLNSISGMICDWIGGFLDKIFTLLDAREEPQKGQKEGGSSIGSCMYSLFRSIDPIQEPVLWELVESKILNYFKNSMPKNAVKISSLIFEAWTNKNASSLNHILVTLLDSDVLNGICSTEKLAFRLRLCGGALRCCQGKVFEPENYAIISPFFTKEYTHHTDKHVRKAVLKLIKDSLKGSIFIYPKDVSPYDDKLKNVIGAPNNYQNPQYTWYVPSSLTLSKGKYSYHILFHYYYVYYY